MLFLEKIYKFLIGLVLMAFHYKKLDFNNLIKDKRVAIVGAANSAFQTGKGHYIDGFDVVIRINKAPYMLMNGNAKDDIGTKANILFHSFFENEQFGGGPLNFEIYDKLGVEYVVNPIPNFFGMRNTFNFYKKYLSGRVTYTLQARPYRKLVASIQNYRPTIGMCALAAALEGNFKELYITGFTFFKTNYGDGYRNALTEVQQVRSAMDNMKIHNPDIEFDAFVALLKKHRSKNILMDPVLTDIIHRNDTISESDTSHEIR